MGGCCGPVRGPLHTVGSVRPWTGRRDLLVVPQIRPRPLVSPLPRRPLPPFPSPLPSSHRHLQHHLPTGLRAGAAEAEQGAGAPRRGPRAAAAEAAHGEDREEGTGERRWCQTGQVPLSGGSLESRECAPLGPSPRERMGAEHRGRCSRPGFQLPRVLFSPPGRNSADNALSCFSLITWANFPMGHTGGAASCWRQETERREVARREFLVPFVTHCVWEEPQGSLVVAGTSSLSQWWGSGSHSCSSCASAGSAEPVCLSCMS